MSNNFAPFGFSPTSTSNGPMNWRLSVRRIASSAAAIYKGDAVVPVTSPSINGYIKQATAGAVELAGIFWGCQYLSVSQKRTVWSNYWPGSDNNGDIVAYVINDPNAKFVAQAASGLNITQADVGASISLAGGSGGNTANGISGMYLNTVGTSSTAPFRIVGLVTAPPGSNGTDTASNANYAIVAFLNVSTKTLVTI